MLKKIILLLLLFILSNFSLSSFAEYKPVPQNLKLKYKTEIEYTIKSEIPKSKKAIKNIESEIKKETNPYNRQTIVNYGITSILFDFYMQLVNVTNKYVEIKQDIPPTDWYMELKESITPHLTDNNINTRRIDSLLDYANKKQKELNKKYSNY